MSVFSIIYNDVAEARLWLKRWLFYKRKAIQIDRAIRLADQKQMAENLQNHVLIYSDPIKGDILEPVNRYQIDKLKMLKCLPRHASMIVLQRNSIFYSTPLNRNNKSTSEERKEARKKYLKYAKKYMK